MYHTPVRLGLVVMLIGAIAGTAGAQQSAQSPSFNRAYLDTTCAPCQDFWRFANGAWLGSVQIPPARSWWGRDDLIRARNDTVIRSLLDSLAYAPTRHAHTLGDRNAGVFFRSCMDSSLTATEMLRPLEPELSRLKAIRSRRDVSAAIGRLNRAGVQPFFWFFAGHDPFDPSRIVGIIRSLSGTTLPSRRAYVGADSNNVRLRDGFVAMLTRVFVVLGDSADDAASNARRVVALETALARAQPQDSGGANEKRSLAELEQLAPAFDWRAFAQAIGRPDLPPIYIRTAIRSKIDSLFSVVPADQWGAYLRWRYVLSMAQLLDKSFGGVVDEFFAATSGRQAPIPQAANCVVLTTWRLGDDVARAYVARSFSIEDRKAAVALVERVRGVFHQRLETLEWLSLQTRQRALAKLAAMRLWVGYPDRWEGNAGLTLRDGPAASVFLAVRRFRMDREFAKIGGRADPELWIDANPAFVDLSYYASSNALLITAAALQAPAFDPRVDLLTNLAGIGWGIGHELSHGFDSGGRLFNETGRREEWWAPDDAKEYSRRAELVVNQYSQYVIIDSLRKDGRRTLSENIADIGGVSLAYLSFKSATAGQPDELVDGFTREQRFFIALAQSFPRIATRPAQLRIDAESADGHHVPRWRLNGALANLAAFAAAFGCKDGDPMVLPAALRGNIW